MCVLCICICSWLCICMQMPAFFCVWVWAGACMHVCRSEITVFFNCLHLIFGKGVSHWILSSLIHLDVLDRERQGSACLCLNWYRGCLCSFCNPDISWVLEIQTQVHMTVWQTLCPWSHPNPHIIVPANHNIDTEMATRVLNLSSILSPHLSHQLSGY